MNIKQIEYDVESMVDILRNENKYILCEHALLKITNDPAGWNQCKWSNIANEWDLFYLNALQIIYRVVTMTLIFILYIKI